MSTGDLRRAEAIFLEAVDRVGADRRAVLDARCGGDVRLRAEVQSLLDHHDGATGFLEDGARLAGELGLADDLGLAGRPVPEDAVFPAGTAIGAYSIARVLGRGGMGVVYVAQQERPRRTVALKVIRRGFASPSLVRRFEHEAEVLGRLQHPGIAQIFEAGKAPTPDGERPFIAMELVNGPPINEYCDTRRLGTRERLELAAKVCDAVQHAHQRGVIHRDLKPANILVNELGQPKVLDFGVARAVDADLAVTTFQTSVGQLIGTLPYMSPEQVLADPNEVDTRSDVYALGVVLYQLLTGKLPLDLKSRSIPEAARIIRDEPPARLSSISRVFRGDVETIVSRAIEKDKSRRYQSAADLRDDLLRHLNGEPISARQDSSLSMLRQRLRRYRGAFAAAALFILGLAGFSVYAIVEGVEFRKARDEARAAKAGVESAFAALERERERSVEKARELDARLVESDLARGRAEALLGGVALAEDLIWPRLLREPASDRARWALREVYGRHPCLWTASGVHETAVAAFSPDGAVAAVAQRDGSLVLRRIADGSIAATIPLGGRASSVAFAPDGRAVLVGFQGGAASLWDTVSGAQIASLESGGKAHAAAVTAVAVSADGTRAATGSPDRKVRAWDLTSPTPAPLWTITDTPVNMLAFSPDGATIACATAAREARLRDAATGELRRQLAGHDGGVGAIAYSGDGSVLATVSWDRTARVWNPATGECTTTIPMHLVTVKAIGLSRDGTVLLTAASDELQLWSLPTGAPLGPYLGHANVMFGAALSPDGRRAISIGWDDAVKAWELDAGAARRELAGHGAWVFGVAFNPSGTVLASAGGDATIRTWDAATGAPRHTIPTGRGHNRAVAFSPDGRLLATGSFDGVVRLVNPANGTVVGEMSGSRAEVFAAAFSPDGRTLVTASGTRSGAEEHALRFWDPELRALLGSVTGFTGRALALAYSPDGHTLAVSGDDGVRLIDAPTRTDMGQVPEATASWGLAISPDSRSLAAAGHDGVIRVWSLPTPGPPRLLAGHKRLIAGVAFSPNSSLIVSGSDDGTVRLWDAATGSGLASFELRRGEVSHVAFSPDGRQVAAACQKNAVVLIDLRHFDAHVAGNLDYRLDRHRAVLPEGVKPEAVRAAVLGASEK